MNKKIYVIDTSILLAEGKRAFYSFADAELVIPLVVVRELESKKSDPTLGYSARSALRELNTLRDKGDIQKGVDAGNGITVRVERNHIDSKEVAARLGTAMNNDAKIISVAYTLAESSDCDVTILTKDISLKILGDLCDLKSQDLVKIPANRQYIDQVVTLEIGADQYDELREQGKVRLDHDVPVNTGVVLKAGTSSALAIAKPGYSFTLVPDAKIGAKMQAGSKEQHIAMKQLRDDTIKAVSLGGPAGTGKTVMALAAGYDAVIEHGYKKISVFRSMHAVGGEELGFLPGTEAEKMDPWTQAIYDALAGFLTPQQINQLKSKGQIEVLPITFVRGRTLSGPAFIIVDEAQNLSRDTIKTLLTRVGAGSKIVLTHDVSQRDNIRVNRWEGIYDVVARMHGNKLFSHIEMVKSERSELAQTAGALLDDD